MSIPTPSSDEPEPASELEETPSELEKTPSEAGTLNADLLEEVLKETIAATDVGKTDGGSLEILTQVAGRHRGQDLTLDPVMVDLVQSLLQSRFPSLTDNGSLWRDMTLQIAETLLHDPVTHDRLQALWRRINEAIR